MSDAEKLDFYERWIKTLDNLMPEVRGKINGASISLTGYYIGVDVHGIVDVHMTEAPRWMKKP